MMDLVTCADVAASPKERAQAMLNKMTNAEKIAMVHGYGAKGGTSGYVGLYVLLRLRVLLLAAVVDRKSAIPACADQ